MCFWQCFIYYPTGINLERTHHNLKLRKLQSEAVTIGNGIGNVADVSDETIKVMPLVLVKFCTCTLEWLSGPVTFKIVKRALKILKG